ncbi:hypothetical protein JCM10213_007343 [Rhodosporidiobolus nylandii]
MASKRALASSQPSSSSSQPTRPSKRAKRSPPPPASSSLPEPSTLLSQIPPTPSQPPSSAPAAPPLPPLPPAKKRPRVEGTLRRLSTGHPALSSSRTASGPRGNGGIRPTATLAGERVGGESKDLKDGADEEEMWVRREGRGAKGMGFAGYLKRGVSAFVERGCTTLTVHGMGAAIPLALSLALAIRDALPGGEPSPSRAAGETGDDGEEELVKMKVTTGSKVVRDEITPEDEDEDPHLQQRTKSTVSVELSLSQPLASALGQAGKPRKERGGASRRGRGRRGAGGGR